MAYGKSFVFYSLSLNVKIFIICGDFVNWNLTF